MSEIKMVLLNTTPIPRPKLHATAEIIAVADPRNSGACILSQTIRLQLGASSVHVTAETMRFNAMGPDRDGTIKLMRYIFPTPPYIAAKVIKFDTDAEERGIEYARSQCQPFKFQLPKGGMACPVEKRPQSRPRTRTINRSKDSTKRCERRYRGLRVIEVREVAA